MSLKETIRSNVANAFEMLGDLKTEITFLASESRGYDFSSGDVSETTNQVIANEYNKFDTFTISDINYKIISYEDNGFAIEGLGISE